MKPSTNKVLVIGSGAREHALAWRLSQEAEVVCAPGNAGTVSCARNVAIDATNYPALVELALTEQVELVLIGPEKPLVDGLADRLSDAGIPVWGPNAAAAQLEGSKTFAKHFMQRHGIPTADFAVFDDADAAKAYILEKNSPLVVKADGLAGGKGVVIAANAEEACAAVDSMMKAKRFGDAGCSVVIESCLEGEEISYHVLSDGEAYVPLAAAQDHKRLEDGDRGPNTGGMGAYSPPACMNKALEKEIQESIVEPTLRGMREEGRSFRGTLFVGLMIVDGRPYVLEYNVRFGDPECQVLMLRWQGSLLDVLRAGLKPGSLYQVKANWHAPAALNVVLAAQGYPIKPICGDAITGIDDTLSQLGDVAVFHAGTQCDEEGVLRSSGGRVLSISAIGDNLREAAQKAYHWADTIDYTHKIYRRDIGWRALR